MGAAGGERCFRVRNASTYMNKDLDLASESKQARHCNATRIFTFLEVPHNLRVFPLSRVFATPPKNKLNPNQPSPLLPPIEPRRVITA